MTTSALFRPQILLVILGMALVTYLPRALPALLHDRLRLHSRVERFLNLIPYTALTALIFPGIFTVDAQRPWIGAIGGALAAVLAWRRCPLLVCVIAAIAVDYLLLLLLP